MAGLNKNNDNKPKLPKKPPKFNYYWIYLIIVGLLLGSYFLNMTSNAKQISWEEFRNEILPHKDDVAKLVIVNDEMVEVYLSKEALDKQRYKEVTERSFGFGQSGPHYQFTIGEGFEDNLKVAYENLDYAPEEEIKKIYDSRRGIGDFISIILPFAIIIIIWIFIMRRMSGGVGGPGGQIFNIGKSKATLFDKDSKVNVTFNDVAGLNEAKEEVKEIVDFLRTPEKYTKLGGKIPKGALLIGAPGTGKTLLAKAMAGEAKVPFFSISGSDFVEMFVGVGASRVRDLFKQAREKAPCIIFIDEIDAIGRARGKSYIQGGNDERENTLNQLLVEMDGFSSEKGVIILAATNRPDVLDPALMRPGRFDRQISIDKPDKNGREEIFAVHLKNIKTSEDVNCERLAAQTPGFAGAEIANVCNEAALIAARKGKKMVEMEDFNDAIDRVIGGLEKKGKIISPEEKKIIAYHEAGHAIAGWYLEHADPLVKVTIVPRGVAALGYAQYLPKEQYLYTKAQLMDSMCMALGGRVAEEIVFGDISTGAQNDLERITKMAYAMVSLYGMDKKIGNVSFNDQRGEYAFDKPYSEETSRMIDETVRTIIEEAHEETVKLLTDKRDELEILAQKLLEKEVLFQHDLEELIGKRPFPAHKEEEPQKDITNAVSGNGQENHSEEKSEKPKKKTDTGKVPASGEEEKDED